MWPSIQQASKTAGCSISEVARVASAELFGRAWFTLPLCDVLRDIQIGVASSNTLRTRKVVAITGSDRTTDRTLLSGMMRIGRLDAPDRAIPRHTRFVIRRERLCRLVELRVLDECLGEPIEDPFVEGGVGGLIDGGAVVSAPSIEGERPAHLVSLSGEVEQLQKTTSAGRRLPFHTPIAPTRDGSELLTPGFPSTITAFRTERPVTVSSNRRCVLTGGCCQVFVTTVPVFFPMIRTENTRSRGTCS